MMMMLVIKMVMTMTAAMAAAAEAAGDGSMPLRGAEPCHGWTIDIAQLCEQKSCGLRYRHSQCWELGYARPLRVLGVHAALQGDRCHGPAILRLASSHHPESSIRAGG